MDHTIFKPNEKFNEELKRHERLMRDYDLNYDDYDDFCQHKKWFDEYKARLDGQDYKNISDYLDDYLKTSVSHPFTKLIYTNCLTNTTLEFEVQNPDEIIQQFFDLKIDESLSIMTKIGTITILKSPISILKTGQNNKTEIG